MWCIQKGHSHGHKRPKSVKKTAYGSTNWHDHGQGPPKVKPGSKVNVDTSTHSFYLMRKTRIGQNLGKLPFHGRKMKFGAKFNMKIEKFFLK